MSTYVVKLLGPLELEQLKQLKQLEHLDPEQLKQLEYLERLERLELKQLNQMEPKKLEILELTMRQIKTILYSMGKQDEFLKIARIKDRVLAQNKKGQVLSPLEQAKRGTKFLDLALGWTQDNLEKLQLLKE